MKYSIIYSSKTGNTALLAEKIKEKISPEKLHYYGAPAIEAIDTDILFIGFWTDKGRCDDNIKSFIESLANKNIVLFGTAGFGGSESYFNEIIQRIKVFIPKSCNLLGSFMCQGKMPQTVRTRYLQTLEKDPSNDRMKSMIENFDKALSHPNNDDFQNLCNFIHTII